MCIPDTREEAFNVHGQKHIDSWLLGLLPDFGRGDAPAVVDPSACWNLLTFSSPRSEISDVGHVDASQISAGDSHKLKSLIFAAQNYNFNTNPKLAYQVLSDTMQSLLYQPYSTLRSGAGKKQ